MTKSSRFILIIGFVISLICGVLTNIERWNGYNPQMVAMMVMLPFSGLAIVTDISERLVQHSLHLAPASLYWLILGLMGGISLASFFLFSPTPDMSVIDVLATLYRFMAFVSYPCAVIALLSMCLEQRST